MSHKGWAMQNSWNIFSCVIHMLLFPYLRLEFQQIKSHITFSVAGLKYICYIVD